MLNIHKRLFDHRIEQVRPWISLAWSGTKHDIFPRDVIPSWRANIDGSDGLVPEKTKLGHGNFVFTLRWWDGVRWRADLDSNAGWHGLYIQAQGAKTRVIHTLDASLSLATRLSVIPIHDWAIEAMFDRLEHALEHGTVPAVTSRPMSFLARRLFDAQKARPFDLAFAK
jgi:hypothetical protein